MHAYILYNVGLSFWKSPRRKNYAVQQEDDNSYTSDEDPMPSRKDVMEIMNSIKADVEEIGHYQLMATHNCH